MAIAKKAKKLYFDITVPTGDVGVYVRCTQVTAGFTSQERYGRLLEDYAAADGSTPKTIRAQREVSAWFQPFSTDADSDFDRVITAANWIIQFMGSTTNALTVENVVFYNGATIDTTRAGFSPVATRHFGVRVKRSGATTGNAARGTLFVQRQHTMEV